SAGPDSVPYNDPMAISARDRLKGTVEEVVLGTVMAHVVVRVGDNLIESAITRRSANELHLKKGDTVTAIIKSTEVMIQKDCARSQSQGHSPSAPILLDVCHPGRQS